MRVVVTSPFAGEAFTRVLKGVEVAVAPVLKLMPVKVEGEAVTSAVSNSDLVVFVSGRAAYRLREEGIRLDLAGKIVATAEGRKGAVMVKNAFGVEPQLVADSAEELARLIESCRVATVFHHGERAEELMKRLSSLCSRAYEFFTYRAVPDDEALRALPPGEVYVFFSALAAELVAARRRDVLERAVIIAAGPAVKAALEKHGLNAAVPPSGRIGEVALFVKRLVEELGNSLGQIG